MDKLQEERDYIFIESDEGVEEKFEVVYDFEVEGNKYLFLVPFDSPDEEEEAEVYVFRYEEEGEDIKLFTIESDDEWNMVEEVFNTLDQEYEV
ncbi:MAG: DUF1292 domain-containing protein [Vulcanibacillus sp.]